MRHHSGVETLVAQETLHKDAVADFDRIRTAGARTSEEVADAVLRSHLFDDHEPFDPCAYRRSHAVRVWPVDWKRLGWLAVSVVLGMFILIGAYDVVAAIVAVFKEIAKRLGA